MPDLPNLDVPRGAGDPSAERRLAAIEHATRRLRQGAMVGIRAEPGEGLPALVLLAAESAGTSAMAALGVRSATPLVAVLSPPRAEAVIGTMPPGPAGFRQRLGSFTAADLQALADPTLPQTYPALDPATAPPGADAALALVKLSGLLPAALVGMAGPAADPDMPEVTRADIFAHPALIADTLVRVTEAVVPIAGMADCRVVVFRAPGTGRDHLAILMGRPETVLAPLVRVHSECFTGDLLGSLRCDCGTQLHGAIERIIAEGVGAVLYLAQEGRGIGLSNKLRAYALQDRGLDTLDANRALGFAGDERDFKVAASMLHALGLPRIRLLTNNPGKLASLGQHGIEVAARVSLRFAANGVNDGYLATKAQRFGHLLGPHDPS